MLFKKKITKSSRVCLIILFVSLSFIYARGLIYQRRQVRVLQRMDMRSSSGILPGQPRISAGVSSINEHGSIQEQEVNEKDLLIIEKLILSGSKAGQMRACARLNALTYDELGALLKKIEGNGSLNELAGLIDAVRSEKKAEGIYIKVEDIIINNLPLRGAESGFYAKDAKSGNMRKINTQSQQLYFDNLKLRGVKNTLVQETADLWINDRYLAQITPPGNEDKNTVDEPLSIDLKRVIPLPQPRWSVEIPDEHLNNDDLDPRWWYKRYEEPLTFPEFYNGKVIARNEYSVFCFDGVSGTIIWEYSLPSRRGNKWYQTLRPKYVNSYGSELLSDGGNIYSEIDGHIIALDVKGRYPPKLIWKKSLGEFSLCTKLIRNRGSIIGGLINDLGELWICAFGVSDGQVRWSTYIGISSIGSPVSALSGSLGDKVLIGTNHGVLVCLDTNSGEIIWLRKYGTRKYSVFDYWYKQRYKDNFGEGAGSIGFDSQFLDLAGAGKFYYKPRESGSFYIIEGETGRLLDELSLPGASKFIGVIKGELFSLEQDPKKDGQVFLRAVNLSNGKKVFEKAFPAAPLRGIVRPYHGSIFFKLGNIVYCIFGSTGGYEVINLELPEDGWLLNYKDGVLLFGKDRSLSSLSIYGQSNVDPAELEQAGNIARQRKEIEQTLSLVSGQHLEIKALKDIQIKILEDIKRAGLPLDGFFSYFLKNIRMFENPSWNDFLLSLIDYYEDGIVAYNGINLKFSSFLYEARKWPEALMVAASARPGYEDKTASLGMFNSADETGWRLVKAETIGIGQLPDFFMAVKNGQLLCVNDTGAIRWSIPVYNQEKRRMLAYFRKIIGKIRSPYLRVYLCDRTVIVNDGLNVIAVNISNGEYLWSMSCASGAGLADEKDYNETRRDDLYKEYEIKWSYLKDYMPRVEFINNKMFVAKGKMVYGIDPNTGYCNTLTEIPMSGPYICRVDNGRLYIVALDLSSFVALDQSGGIISNLQLDILGNEEPYPQVVVLKENMVLLLKDKLVALDLKTGKITDKLILANKMTNWIEPHNDSLLVIAPLKSVSSFKLFKGRLVASWSDQFSKYEKPLRSLFLNRGREYEYFYKDNSMIVFPYEQGKRFGLAGIDLDSGKKIWDKKIAGVKGAIYYISNILKIGDSLQFSVANLEETDTESKYVKFISDITKSAFAVWINRSKRVEVDYPTGRIKRIEVLPDIHDDMFFPDFFAETKNAVIRNMRDSIAIVKKNIDEK